ASAQDNLGAPFIPATSSAFSLELGRYPVFNELLSSQEDPIFLENAFADPRFDVGSQTERALLKGLGLSTIALLPLKTGTGWQSVLCFGWRYPQAPDSETQALFKAITPPVASIVAARRAPGSRRGTRTH